MSFLPRHRFLPGRGYTRESVRLCELNSSLIIAKSGTTGLLAKCLFRDLPRKDYANTVTAGGAVSIKLLHTPWSTHDVLFFGTNIDNDQRKLRNGAARYAERRSQTALGGEWFNNQMMLWLPPNVHRKVAGVFQRLMEVSGSNAKPIGKSPERKLRSIPSQPATRGDS